MKNLKTNLRSVNKEIKALSKRVDKIIVAVEKLEKAKPKAVKGRPEPKAKPAKKVVAKKAAAKKQVKLTAADTALRIIKRYRKGVDVPTLMEKTGFNRRKIYDIVKNLKKQDRVKSAGIGVYLKV